MVRRTARSSAKTNADHFTKQLESPTKSGTVTKRRVPSVKDGSDSDNPQTDLKEVKRDNKVTVNNDEQENSPVDANGEAEGEHVKEDKTSEQDSKENVDGTGKGKSKSYTKTDNENSSSLNENEQQTNSHISETVQVTGQSPSNDKPVDNKSGKDTVNNVQSINCNVENISKDGMKVDDKNTSSEDKIMFSNVSGDIVESENSVDCNNKSVKEGSVNQPSDKDKHGRVSDNDNTQVKESKKIHLRRNTVASTEPAKATKAVERSVSHSALSSEEKQQKDDLSADDSKTIKKVVRIKLRRNNIVTSDEYSTDQNTETESSAENNSSANKQKEKKWVNPKNPGPICKIDFATIKQFCTKVEVLDEKDVKLDLPKERYRSNSESDKKVERKVSIEFNEDSERPDFKKQTSSNTSEDEAKEDKNSMAFNRKISIVDDSVSKLRPPPEPAKNPVSEILFITNLVRPFTLKQLRELLERTGTIEEGGFWTDRIKSKCYVQYSRKDEAELTRNALHGVHWPVGNGKQLMIDYATMEEMENAKNPILTPPRIEIKANVDRFEKENKDPARKRKLTDDEDRKTHRRSPAHVREWDLGKEAVHAPKRKSKSRSRERRRSQSRDGSRSRRRDRSRDRRDRSREHTDRSTHHKHRRTPSPKEDYASKKQRKVEDEVPQKLMDDLFLKTKATPSIYWQPLSPEEIALKQQQRLERMEEHKRRMEVSSRHRGRPESGRGVSSYRRR